METISQEMQANFPESNADNTKSFEFSASDEFAMSEELISSEMLYDSIKEIKSPETLSNKSSYIIQKEPKVISKKTKNVKTRQAAALKSFENRPNTVKEKAKASMKSELTPHALGTIPNYLKQHKDNPKKSLFSEGSKPCRTATVTKIISKQEEQGDAAQSSTLLPVIDVESKATIQSTTDNTKIAKLRTQINDLKKNNDLLQQQLKEAKTTREKIDNELKLSAEKVKNLEMKISRGEQKKNVNLEVQIANLIQDKNDLSAEISKNQEENRKLASQLAQLRNELKTKSNSYETLITENKHLQVLLEHSKQKNEKESSELYSEQLKMLSSKCASLQSELNEKDNEVIVLKQDRHNLIDEISHLKRQEENRQVENKSKELSDEIDRLKKNERDLNQKLLTLSSKLDDERNANSRNCSLLEFRANYIKTLQDVDNVNKTRLVLHAKELEEARRNLKNFESNLEKFKASHAEEKANFKNLLENLVSENMRLKTKLENFGGSGLGSRTSQR